MMKMIMKINPSNDRATFVQSTSSKDFCKQSKPCHVDIHWIALAEHSQMSTHMPGLFLLAKLATSNIRVEDDSKIKQQQRSQ